MLQSSYPPLYTPALHQTDLGAVSLCRVSLMGPVPILPSLLLRPWLPPVRLLSIFGIIKLLFILLMLTLSSFFFASFSRSLLGWPYLSRGSGYMRHIKYPDLSMNAYMSSLGTAFLAQINSLGIENLALVILPATCIQI